MNTLIVGLQYGDEGKGRVSGYFSKEHDWCVRFNGGPNAGHTVYDSSGKKHALHHLPAGVLSSKKIALDVGMVIDPAGLSEELSILGHPIDLYISGNAHIITEKHKHMDKDGSGIGSTKKGIAYVYADRALRLGKRASEIDWKSYGITCQLYYGLVPSSTATLFESAQGIMLDVDYGHYPYVTSSSVMPSSAYRIDRKIGVMKAYTSRVGDGPPNSPQIPELTKKGDEYGTTTGRPRKCHWLDVDELKYGLSLVHPDEIVVTKLDILEGMEIKAIRNDKELVFTSLNSYVEFLVETFPGIKYLSYSPDGSMKRI